MPHDSTLRPLSLKLLERPRLLAQIRDLIPDKDRAHLVPYNTTELERDLAIRLGIPMYGADPRHFELGTKSGCRKLFGRAGVSYPLGAEDLRTADDVLDALARLRTARPHVRSAMVKHNEGVSGAGNAVVNLSDLPAPGDKAERGALLERLKGMQFESARQNYDMYMAKLAELAGIVEERVIGEEIRSPSVQMRITPLGQLEVLSTHDQVLGGPSGQSYLGCRFPADPAYAAVITRDAVKVGQELVGEGVLGRFAFDFVVVRNGAAWTPYAIELNLRKGGTTHPFLTLQFLTDGRYDPESATFTPPSGRPKCFVATDHLESELYRGLLPQDVFDIMVRHGLHFNQTRQTGVVLPHADGAVGARAARPHRRRRDASGGRRDLPAGRRRAGPRGGDGDPAGPPAPGVSEPWPDPELLRSVFEGTEVLRKPISGIITGHHVLPYVLVGPHWDNPGRSVEVRGRIRVSPRLVLPVRTDGPTYGDVFSDRELMHQALIARVFSFKYAPKVLLESEDLRIQRQDRAPQAHLELVLDELLRQEVINTGVIRSPDVRYYPVSIDRFIREILDQEFRE